MMRRGLIASGLKRASRSRCRIRGRFGCIDTRRRTAQARGDDRYEKMAGSCLCCGDCDCVWSLRVRAGRADFPGDRQSADAGRQAGGRCDRGGAMGMRAGSAGWFRARPSPTRGASSPPNSRAAHIASTRSSAASCTSDWTQEVSVAKDGAVAKPIELRLQKGCKIEGSAIDMTTGGPVAGMKISTYEGDHAESSDSGEWSMVCARATAPSRPPRRAAGRGP